MGSSIARGKEPHCLHSLVSFGSYLFLVSVAISISFICTLDSPPLHLCFLHASGPSPAPPPLQPISLLCQKQGVSSLGTVWHLFFIHLVNSFLLNLCHHVPWCTLSYTGGHDTLNS